MKNQLISILIPAYNAEKWIGETIKSCVEQSWNNKEIIVVDDGSKDKTLSVVRQCKSTQLKIVSQENQGGCNARNKALSLAQGSYIQWLDADDTLHKNKLYEQMIFAEDGINSKQLLTSPCGLFYRNVKKAKFIQNNLWQDLGPVEWMLYKFSENIWMAPLSWLISRKLTELAGPWNEKIIKDQDGEYICRVIKNCDSIKFVKDSISYYRIGNVSSVSNNKSYKAADSAIYSAKLCIDYLLELEKSDRTLNACIKLIQHRYSMCYPDKPDIAKKAEEIASGLGGSLYPPKEKYYYGILRVLFGNKIKDNIKRVIRYNKTKIKNVLEYIY